MGIGSGEPTYVNGPRLVEYLDMYGFDAGIVSMPCGFRVWLSHGTEMYYRSNGSGGGDMPCLRGQGQYR